MQSLHSFARNVQGNTCKLSHARSWTHHRKCSEVHCCLPSHTPVTVLLVRHLSLFTSKAQAMLVPMPHMPAANVVSADSAALTALTAVHLEGFGIWSQSRTAQLVLEKLTHPRSKEMVECFLQIPSIISHECLKARGWIVAKSRSNPCGAWKSTDPLLAEASDS